MGRMDQQESTSGGGAFVLPTTLSRPRYDKAVRKALPAGSAPGRGITCCAAAVKMDRQELTAALEALDRELASPCDIVLVGGAAMLLHFGANRATRDVDVIPLRGDLGELRRAVAAVAASRDLPPRWMNDAAKGFADILPRDFPERLVSLGLPLDRLRIFVLGRPEQVAMKMVALREQDLEDLDLLMPEMSALDKETLVNIIQHVATFRPDWAQKMRYFVLEQGWEID
jgi:uncharacterized nucleotidyltransferase DUF6036